MDNETTKRDKNRRQAPDAKRHPGAKKKSIKRVKATVNSGNCSIQ
jgi:hypothetical protein